MALKIEIAEPYVSCSSCGSNEDVVTITAIKKVGNAQFGSRIALCESCAQCLRLQLQDRYKGYRQYDYCSKGAKKDVHDN